MSTRIVKWALVILVAANVLVAAAWWAKNDLVKAGFLAAPPASRVDLGKRSLPPIAVVESEDATAATPERPTHADEPAPAPTCIVAGPFEDKPAAKVLAARFVRRAAVRASTRRWS